VPGAQLWYITFPPAIDRTGAMCSFIEFRSWQRNKTATCEAEMNMPNPLTERLAHLESWTGFVSALDEANEFWSHRDLRKNPDKYCHAQSVTDTDKTSWLKTANMGRLVVSQPDWSRLSSNDIDLIMGKAPHAFLGCMDRATSARNHFVQNINDIRSVIRRALQQVIDASADKFANTCCAFIGELKKHSGFGPGIATRMLVLARPDRAICVNGGSKEGLACLTNLPRTSLGQPFGGPRSKSYLDLLRWFENQEWYFNPRPRDAREKQLADVRGALVDAFVYSPENAGLVGN
jgi:hypothetical protein